MWRLCIALWSTKDKRCSLVTAPFTANWGLIFPPTQATPHPPYQQQSTLYLGDHQSLYHCTLTTLTKHCHNVALCYLRSVEYTYACCTAGNVKQCPESEGTPFTTRTSIKSPRRSMWQWFRCLVVQGTDNDKCCSLAEHHSLTIPNPQLQRLFWSLR